MSNPVLSRDLALDDDFVLLPGGDVATREGLDNFVQALRVRLSTEKGELWSHPTFGVRMRRFVKAANTPLNRMDVEVEVADAIESDPARSRIGNRTEWSSGI